MSASRRRRSLYFTAPRHVEVADEAVGAPSAGELLVETVVSAISGGTELLVYRDEVPATMALDAAIAGLTGGARFPVKYGYCAVGRVVDAGPAADPGWLGRLVFSMHPHESHFLASAGDLHPVPAGIAAEEATLFANVETAVTLTMDGRPMIGERVGVFGQGVVGLLTTALLAKFPLAGLVTVDLHSLRRRLSREMGAHEARDPAAGAEPGDHAFDLVYELSGSPAVLDSAIAETRFHGRVVIGSWYGDRRAAIDLGGEFHRSRIQVVSSQVSTIDPALTGRWTSERRRSVTWSLLAEMKPARLVTHRFPLAAAAEAYELLDRHPGDAVQVLLTYDT